MIEKGYEHEMGVPVEIQVIRKIEMEEVRALMDAKDTRIWKAFSMKEIFGESVDTIKDELGVSAARVYQLVAEAHTIGRQYRKETTPETITAAPEQVEAPVLFSRLVLLQSR